MRHNATRHVVWLVDEENLLSVRSSASVLALKFGWPMETLEQVVEGKFSRGEDSKPTLDVVTPRIYAEMLREGAPLHRTSLILVQTTHALLNPSARDHAMMKFIFKRYSNESSVTRPKLALFTSGITFTSELELAPHAIPPSELLPLLTALVPNLGIAELSSNEMDAIIRGLILETRGYLLEKTVPSLSIESLQRSFASSIFALLSLYVDEAEPGSQQDKYHTEARKDGSSASEYERRAEYLEPLLPYYTHHSKIIYESGLINLEFLRKIEKIAKNWEKAPPQLILNAIAIITHGTLLLSDLGPEASINYVTKYLAKLIGNSGRRPTKNSAMDKFIALATSLQRSISAFRDEIGLSASSNAPADQLGAATFAGRSSVLFDLLHKSLVEQPATAQNHWKPKFVVHAATSVSARQLKKLLVAKYPAVALFQLGEASDEETCEEFFQLGHQIPGEAMDEHNGPSVLITVPSSRRVFTAEFEKYTRAHPHCRPRFMPRAIFGPHRSNSDWAPAPPSHERFSPEYSVDSIIILRLGSSNAYDTMRTLKECSESETVVTLKTSNFSLAALLSGLPAVLQEFKLLVTSKIDVVAECHQILDTIKEKVLKRYQAPAVIVAPTTSTNANGVSTTSIKPVGPISKDEHAYAPGMGSTVPPGADWYSQDRPAHLFTSTPPASRSTQGAVTRGAVTQGAVTHGAVTHGAVTHGPAASPGTDKKHSESNGHKSDTARTTEQQLAGLSLNGGDHIIIGNKKVPYTATTPPPSLAAGNTPMPQDNETRPHIDYASAFTRQGSFMTSFMGDHATPLPALTPHGNNGKANVVAEPALPQSAKTSTTVAQQQQQQPPLQQKPSSYDKAHGFSGSFDDPIRFQGPDQYSQMMVAPVTWDGGSYRTNFDLVPQGPYEQLVPQGPASSPPAAAQQQSRLSFDSKSAPSTKTTSPPTPRQSLDYDSPQGPHSLNSAMDEVMPMPQSKSSFSSSNNITSTPANTGKPSTEVAYDSMATMYDNAALYGTSSNPMADYDPSSDYMRATEAAAAAAQASLPMTASANVLTAQNMIASTGANKSETNSDPISLLHIYYSKLGSVDPTYEETVIGGSDHARVYQAICTLPTGETFEGTGNRKKEAKKVAAAHALEYVANIPASNYLNPPPTPSGVTSASMIPETHPNLVHPSAIPRRPVLHFQSATLPHPGSSDGAGGNGAGGSANGAGGNGNGSTGNGGGSSSASMNQLLSGGTYRPSTTGSSFPSWLGGSISGNDSPSPPTSQQPQQQPQQPQQQQPQHAHSSSIYSHPGPGYSHYSGASTSNGSNTGSTNMQNPMMASNAASINSNMGSTSYHPHSGGGGGARTQSGGGGPSNSSGGGYGINGLGNGGSSGYYGASAYMPSSSSSSADSGQGPLELPLTHHNPIGLVNEYHQKNNIVLPTYHDAGRASGSDHEPLFRCICVLNDGTLRSFESSGTSKKEAKTNVAIAVAKELRLLAR